MSFDDVFRSIVLGVIQGLTEFLPISSSAHLAILPHVFGWSDPGASYTAVIQIGTELAVLLYFWRDLWTIAVGWLNGLGSAEARGSQEWRTGWFIIIGSIPIVVLGVSFQGAIDRELRSLWIMGTTLVVFGVILGIADRVGRRNRGIDTLTLPHAVLYGLAQSLALIPGVSRSGATLSMGLLLGYERAAATRYSFLLAVPAVVGAGLFNLSRIGSEPNAYGIGPTIVGGVVAFGVGLAVIHWLLQYVSNHSFTPFVIYRILLGAGVLLALSLA